MLNLATPETAKARSGFSILLRGLNQPADKGQTITGHSVEDAFRTALQADLSKLKEPLLFWKDKNAAVCLDFDKPDDQDPIDDIDVRDLFPDWLPTPLFAWRSHGGGLHALFVAADGQSARESAGAWAISAQLGRLWGWKLEALSQTRHPRGHREDQQCGSIKDFTPSCHWVVPGNPERPMADRSDIEGFLEEHGYSFGRRSTEGCPLCGCTTKQSGADPVVINHWGVYCHKCKKGKSWDQLVGHAPPSARFSLFAAARALVHFPHQRLILKYDHPRVPDELLKPAWKLALHLVNEDWINSDEKEREERLARVKRAASNYNAIIRSSGNTWLDARSLRSRKKVTAVTTRALPWAGNGPRAEMALDDIPLEGFTRVHPLGPSEVVAPYVEPPPGSVTARKPRLNGEPPPADDSLRPSDSDVEAAWSGLEEKLPGISKIRGYLSGLVTAAFVAQRHGGSPPIVAATGRTGGGKSAGQYAAGSMIGKPAKKIILGESKATFRQIGLALEEGHGLLLALRRFE